MWPDKGCYQLHFASVRLRVSSTSAEVCEISNSRIIQRCLCWIRRRPSTSLTYWFWASSAVAQVWNDKDGELQIKLVLGPQATVDFTSLVWGQLYICTGTEVDIQMELCSNSIYRSQVALDFTSYWIGQALHLHRCRSSYTV